MYTVHYTPYNIHSTIYNVPEYKRLYQCSLGVGLYVVYLKVQPLIEIVREGYL